MRKNKPTSVQTNAIYDPEERKNFLTRIKHSKEIKKKNAIKRAELQLKEERKERHKLRKEKADQFAKELMEKQQKLGIHPLDIISQGPSAVIPTIEVHVEKNTEDIYKKESNGDAGKADEEIEK